MAAAYPISLTDTKPGEIGERTRYAFSPAVGAVADLLDVGGPEKGACRDDGALRDQVTRRQPQ
jgi:hypothetical protein